MSKKIPVILAFILFALLVSSQAFAQGSAPMSDVALKYVSYFFALGLAVYGGTQAQAVVRGNPNIHLLLLVITRQQI